MPSQTRNYVLFFLSVLVVLAGWPWLRDRIWPPPPKLTMDQYLAVQRGGQLLAAMPGGFADAPRLAVAGLASAATQEQAKEYVDAIRREHAEKLAAAKPTKPFVPTKPAELIEFGGDGYYLSGRFTNRGAGVHDLTVNPFHAADWFGLPARDANGQPELLQLIPPQSESASYDVNQFNSHDAAVRPAGDETGDPAFSLYHYATAGKDEQRPLDTLGKRDWQLVEKKLNADEQHVVYATELRDFGVRIVKIFTLKPNEYHLGLTVHIERLPDVKEAKPLRYQLAGARGLPIEGVWYTNTFRNALFNWVDARGYDTRNLFDNRSIVTRGGTDRFQQTGPRLQYAAVVIQFFTSAIVVAENQPNFIEFARATLEANPDKNKPQLSDITVRTISQSIDLKPGDATDHKYVLYHGPVKVMLLKGMAAGKGGIDTNLASWYADTLHLRTLTDYGSLSGGFFSFWSEFIIVCTNAVHWLIGILRPICIYDGICIIVVTVLVRLIMMPLSRRQQASMARTQEAMAKIQPEIKKLNERYKNDLVAKQQAQMELYRKHNINPAAGLGGCLMIFVQMPIFLGLYFALQESFFFRLQPFLWIRNLTAPDMLIWWSENIPFISDPLSMGTFFYLGPYFNLLPVVALGLMFFQMKYMQPPPADEAMAQQQKMMQYIMIPLFAFMFYKMAAGLCLYFIATTLWGLAERKWLPKKKPAAEPAANTRPGARGKDKRQPAALSNGRQGLRDRLRGWWQRVLQEAEKNATTRRRK
jgi:YidC/Oxa1 family membrane protein insertase